MLHAHKEALQFALECLVHALDGAPTEDIKVNIELSRAKVALENVYKYANQGK